MTRLILQAMATAPLHTLLSAAAAVQSQTHQTHLYTDPILAMLPQNHQDLRQSHRLHCYALGALWLEDQPLRTEDVIQPDEFVL